MNIDPRSIRAMQLIQDCASMEEALLMLNVAGGGTLNVHPGVFAKDPDDESYVLHLRANDVDYYDLQDTPYSVNYGAIRDLLATLEKS